MSGRGHQGGYTVPGPWDIAMAYMLRGICAGVLEVRMPDGTVHRFAGTQPGPSAIVAVRDTSLARRIVAGGDVAFAEAYMDGLWDTPDLAAVLDLGLANLSAGWTGEVPFVLRPLYRLWHALHDNDTRGGAKRNIAAHYDLGNEFYSLWLDESMTYSSAVLAEEDSPLTPERLEQAQQRKWDRMLELIQPGSGDHVLEIGCGWGGFAIHAAREAGCRVTGITLSEEQADHASTRVREEGLDGRVDIRLQDYREVDGVFDAVASIEMFEAVGERWWPVFFDRMGELLAPGAAAALQVITIAEDRYDAYRRNPDFIQRYIFPGGMLPSIERFGAAAEAAGLAPSDMRLFGRDYAATLSAWAARFEGVLPQVRALGFDERFIRMWRYYLAYCRAGFESGAIDVMQVRLAR